jgi:hypothetical protein
MVSSSAGARLPEDVAHVVRSFPVAAGLATAGRRGGEQQASDQRQPSWLPQECSLEMELQEYAELGARSSEPDPLQPSC